MKRTILVALAALTFTTSAFAQKGEADVPPPAAAEASPPTDSAWRYRTQTDEMRGTQTTRATLSSTDNEAYGGHLQVFVDRHPRGQFVILLQTSDGSSFDCPYQQGRNGGRYCFLTLRVGNSTNLQRVMVERLGDRPDAVHVLPRHTPGPEGLLEMLERGDTFLIEADMYRAGRTVWSFAPTAPLTRAEE